MENIQIEDLEEARRLTTSRQPLKKSFADRNNKLLHYLIGITILGGVIVFFPSWTVIIQTATSGNNTSDTGGGIFGSSRISKLRRYDITGEYVSGRKDEVLIPSCAEQTFLTLYTELPLQAQQLEGDGGAETIDEQQQYSKNSKNACKGMLL